MIVGIPKEIKNNENRVALMPYGAKTLVQHGHRVLLETGAGALSGCPDEAYVQAGAEIVAHPADVFAQADLIGKVKEPMGEELSWIRPDQAVFTYFHFASNRRLTEAMIQSRAICIAYETVQLPNRTLPLLVPMSEVAGRAAIQIGTKYLAVPYGGKGILVGGVAGVRPAKVLVLGGGVVGFHAARSAAGMGAEVVICDISLPRLRELANILPANVQTLYASDYNIRCELPTTDLVVGAVLVPGAKAPRLLTRDMLPLLEPGSVLVDIAIDQGGAFESSRETTHDEPVFVEEGILHYGVANIPGAFPHTSTPALTNATLPYFVELADKGWKRACDENSALHSGLNIVSGEITYSPVADAFNR